MGAALGGNFATGRFTRGDQYLEIHFRYSLGLVTFRWGDSRLSHADYLAGLGETGTYPGYGTDPLNGFRHLVRDLTGPLSGFRDRDRGGYERSLQAAKQPCLERFRDAGSQQLRLASISSSRHERSTGEGPVPANGWLR